MYVLYIFKSRLEILVMDIVTENFIKTRFPEDQWAPYEDCLSIFSQTSGDQVEAILLDIISQEEHYERNDLLTHFHETCCNFLTAMIKEMGVFVVTDAALSFLVRLYNALDALGDHQDKETLIQICQMQETDIMDQFFASTGLPVGSGINDLDTAIAEKMPLSITVVNDPYDGQDQLRIKSFRKVKVEEKKVEVE